MTPGPEKPRKDDVFSQTMRYLPVVGLMPSSAAAGFVIGYGLDHLFSTTFLRWIFLVLGVVSGIVQVVRMVSKDD